MVSRTFRPGLVVPQQSCEAGTYTALIVYQGERKKVSGRLIGRRWDTSPYSGMCRVATAARRMRACVLGVELEHRPLEVLHEVGLAVEVGYFGELVRDGIALLGQAAVLVPVLQEPAAHRVACFSEQDAVRGVWLLVGRAVRVLLAVTGKYLAGTVAPDIEGRFARGDTRTPSARSTAPV